mmetsp:Transcript_39436/g.102225  ORF Transcript_39436/g.102225 Transcript_39436/m.102225 type:complete len:117 (+) Transcript_39436:109-459(+)
MQLPRTWLSKQMFSLQRAHSQGRIQRWQGAGRQPHCAESGSKPIAAGAAAAAARSEEAAGGDTVGQGHAALGGGLPVADGQGMRSQAPQGMDRVSFGRPEPHLRKTSHSAGPMRWQ